MLLARARWLFQNDTATSVPAAVRLVPYQAEYVARLAAWREPERTQLLKRAISLNPFDFQSLIQLGIHHEFQERQIDSAEQFYLKAANVNTMFLPKWTLTNFYFRHQREPEFFHWAQATLAITPYSPEPIFVQMWVMSQDPARIAAALPARPRILLPYAWFLSNNRQFAPIPDVIQRMVTLAGNAHPEAWGRDDLLAAIEDRLVSDGRRDAALQVWSTLARAGWIHKSIPSLAQPITNGDFRSKVYPHGFDWTMIPAEGVGVEQYSSEGKLHLRFSGNQQENATLLQQYVPLQQGKTYSLNWKIHSSLNDETSGLTWRIRPAGHNLAAGAASQDINLSSTTGWRFNAPPGGDLALLTLEYSRPYGHARVAGTVILEDVSSRRE
jgi:hypothetical protein